jgi:hypothetical protein
MKREDRSPSARAAGPVVVNNGFPLTAQRWPDRVAATQCRTPTGELTGMGRSVSDEAHPTRGGSRAFPNLRESPNVSRLKDIRKSFDESS